MPSKPTPAQRRVLEAARDGSLDRVHVGFESDPPTYYTFFPVVRDDTRSALACVRRGWLWDVNLTPAGRAALAESEVES